MDVSNLLSLSSYVMMSSLFLNRSVSTCCSVKLSVQLLIQAPPPPPRPLSLSLPCISVFLAGIRSHAIDWFCTSLSLYHCIGCTSQLSGITADFSGGCDWFCDGFFRPRRTEFATDFVAGFLSCVSIMKKTDFVTNLRSCELGHRR